MIENSVSEELSNFESQNQPSVKTLTKSLAEERLKKISKEMSNLISKQKKEKIVENVNYDEKVADDDIRYIIACDMAADMLKEEYSSKTKPEYIKYENIIPLFDFFKNAFLGIAVVFLILGRPDWCVQKGSSINFECTRSLDPNNPVTYESSSLPMLSDKTKMMIGMMAMLICNVASILKIKMTVSNNLLRQCFVLSVFLNVLYVIFYLIDIFFEYQVKMSDLVIVIFLIFNIVKVQKIFIRSFQVIWLSKSIIYFFLMFGLMMGVICRVMFYDEDDYYDDNISPFYGFNYTSFGKSLYTGILTGLGGNGTYDGILRYYETSPIKMVFWICIFLLFALLISNFLVGSLMSYYDELFARQVDFIAKHPKLKLIIKEFIGKNTLSSTNLQQGISFYVKQGSLDKELIDIENFFADTADPVLDIQNSKNKDSISAFLYKHFNKKLYKIVIGAFEGVCLFFIVISLDSDPINLIYTYKIIFFFQICLVIDQFTRLLTKEIKIEDWVLFGDIALSLISCCYICISLLVENELYYVNFSQQYTYYKIMLGLMIVLKAYRFYTLIFMRKQINTIVTGTFNALPFIGDILFAIGIFFLIFGTIGISIYGGNINSGSADTFMKVYGEELDGNVTLFNFNDYYHAFLTMFMIMQTGWGGYDKTNTLGMELYFAHNFFFVGLFFFSNIILQNILIGFLCNNTGACMAALEADRQEKIDAGIDPDKDSEDSESEHSQDGGEDGDEKAKLSMKESVKEEDLDDFLEYNKPAGSIQDSQLNEENQGEQEEVQNVGTTGNRNDPLAEVFNEIKTSEQLSQI